MLLRSQPSGEAHSKHRHRQVDTDEAEGVIRIHRAKTVVRQFSDFEAAAADARITLPSIKLCSAERHVKANKSRLNNLQSFSRAQDQLFPFGFNEMMQHVTADLGVGRPGLMCTSYCELGQPCYQYEVSVWLLPRPRFEKPCCQQRQNLLGEL